MTKHCAFTVILMVLCVCATAQADPLDLSGDMRELLNRHPAVGHLAVAGGTFLLATYIQHMSLMLSFIKQQAVLLAIFDEMNGLSTKLRDGMDGLSSSELELEQQLELQLELELELRDGMKGLRTEMTAKLNVTNAGLLVLRRQNYSSYFCGVCALPHPETTTSTFGASGVQHSGSMEVFASPARRDALNAGHCFRDRACIDPTTVQHTHHCGCLQCMHGPPCQAHVPVQACVPRGWWGGPRA